MTNAYDLTRQARWEVEGFRRAAEEYERARAVADPAALPSGQRILREVVPPLEARILVAQREALRMVTQRGGGSRLHPWALPVQLLDADVLAVLTLCEALSGVLIEGGGMDVPVTAAALAIATAAQDEVHFRTWIKDHREKRKEDGSLRDLEAAFKREYPNPDRRAWRSWRRRMDLATAEPWDIHTKLHLGAALIHWLLEAAPHRFEQFERREDGKTRLCLRLSEETVRQMNDLEQRKALVRPRMLPMLIPPMDWAYEDDDLKAPYAEKALSTCPRTQGG